MIDFTFVNMSFGEFRGPKDLRNNNAYSFEMKNKI